MSTRTEKQAEGGGLSVTTLVIASVSSVVAAYFIHTIWTGGAILGAGITPIIVAIISESLKKPSRRISALREERRARATVSRRTPDDVPVAPPPELERPDPYGIWQDDRRPGFHWVRGRALKLAIVTGLVAFGIAAFVVTGADLVFGGGGNGDGDRLKIVPGTQERSADRDEDLTTQPAGETETVPESELPAPRTPETTPAPPPETTPVAPPTTTTPAPEQTVPAEPAPTG